MDFFERQNKAKKKTGVLVFLFCVAVLLISLLNFLIIAAVIPFVDEERNFSTLQDPVLAVLVFMGTFAVIGMAGLFRRVQLSGGGSSIAAMMGGRLVNMATTDPDERKLMNVVEEMAIASSVALPEVYVMDGEEAINAFAAGYTLDDAVIGVTEGCMRKLSRDELQGVIAHEFSHILNQDMKLNLRLVSVVFGLIALAVIGRVLLRIGFYSSHGRSRRSSENGGGGGALAIGIIGLGLMATSGLGILMGNLIKSAVSRQREYLADSSAVQFTRNPEGLAGALKKIGALSGGSRLLSTPNAEEASHMFFGNALSRSWFSITSTHPPLLERIQLLEPSFDGDFSGVRFDQPPPPRRQSAPRKTSAGIPIPGMGDALGQALPPVIMGLAAAGKVQVGSAAAVADSVGNPTQQHIDFAAALLAVAARGGARCRPRHARRLRAGVRAVARPEGRAGAEKAAWPSGQTLRRTNGQGHSQVERRRGIARSPRQAARRRPGCRLAAAHGEGSVRAFHQTAGVLGGGGREDRPVRVFAVQARDPASRAAFCEAAKKNPRDTTR